MSEDLPSCDWKLAMNLGGAEVDTGEPRMITLVVPSPHSSSWVLLSSIMFFAAGWATSISRKIAFPSFVSLGNGIRIVTRDMSIHEKNSSREKIREDRELDSRKGDKRRAYKIPPIGSRIIFSIAFGPKHVLITSATVYQLDVSPENLFPGVKQLTFAAVMFEIWAFLPDCRSGVVSGGPRLRSRHTEGR